MGGLLFGYDWVVIGGAKPFYEPAFHITGDPWLSGWAMASALVGCVFGAACSGLLADRFGRQRLLLLSGLTFTVTGIGTALAKDFAWFNVFRLIGGLGIGLASNLSPMYIAEIAPAKVRGRFVSINQLTIVIGILLAQIVNLMIARPTPTGSQLHLMLIPPAAVSHLSSEQARHRAAGLKLVNERALATVRREFPTLDLGQAARRPTVNNATLEAAYIRHTWNGQRGWRWMFAAESVPAILFFLLLFAVPESPRWLLQAGRREAARKIISRVGGSAYADQETARIEDNIRLDQAGKSKLRDLFDAKLTPILGLGIFLAVFQQWCGINVIFNYAQNVFEAAGYSVNQLMMQIVITGLVNLVFTIAAMGCVDRLGRRPLMLFGAASLTCVYALLSVGYFVHLTGWTMVALIVAAIACYAMSLAPITWVVISEIFPNRIRGTAMSVAVVSLWIACTLLTYTFPPLNAAVGASGTFGLYGAICLLSCVIIFFKLPETKGKSLEQIESELTVVTGSKNDPDMAGRSYEL